jgi:uncharacterized OB-fold protein
VRIEDDELWDHDDQDEADPDEADVDEMRCPACGTVIYELAERCPACGEYITDEVPGAISGRPRTWVIATAIVALIAFLLLILI